MANLHIAIREQTRYWSSRVLFLRYDAASGVIS